MNTEELARLINSRFDRLDDRLRTIETTFAAHEASDRGSFGTLKAQASEHANNQKATNVRLKKVENLIERGKGIRWLLGILLVVFTLLNNWQKFLGE